MNPYRNPEVRQYVKRFLQRYYSDNRRRIAVFGINPGRFGAGITGITFTDPVALETLCGILNDLPKKREPSSVFVYAFAERFGGPAKLFRDFFLTAVSPLGFTKDGRNTISMTIPLCSLPHSPSSCNPCVIRYPSV